MRTRKLILVCKQRRSDASDAMETRDVRTSEYRTVTARRKNTTRRGRLEQQDASRRSVSSAACHSAALAVHFYGEASVIIIAPHYLFYQ